MTLDLVVLAFLAFFAVGGAWSGAARQVGNLAGLVAAALAARPLAGLVAPALAHRIGAPVWPTAVAAGVLLFGALYAVTSRAVRWGLGAVLPEGEHGAVNRLGGFLVGLARGAAIAWLVLSLLALAEDGLVRVLPRLRATTESSQSLGFARRHNALVGLSESGSWASEPGGNQAVPPARSP